jgi:hypothetical protein
LTSTSTTELEYTDPETGERITKEMWDFVQDKLQEDKNFLVQTAIDNYDIDAAAAAKIKELSTRDFNTEEYLAEREKLIEKNLQRVSRSDGAGKWKCTDCKVTGDIFFMYQHECSESRAKKKKIKTAVEAKAKDKSSVKQTVFWAGESSKDTPPSANTSYLGPAWLTQTYHTNKQASDQSVLGGAL